MGQLDLARRTGADDTILERRRSAAAHNYVLAQRAQRLQLGRELIPLRTFGFDRWFAGAEADPCALGLRTGDSQMLIRVACDDVEEISRLMPPSVEAHYVCRVLVKVDLRAGSARRDPTGRVGRRSVPGHGRTPSVVP